GRQPLGVGGVAGRRPVVATRPLPRGRRAALHRQDRVTGTAFRQRRHQVLVRPQVARVLQGPRVGETQLFPHVQQQPARRGGELRRQGVVVHGCLLPPLLLTFPARQVC